MACAGEQTLAQTSSYGELQAAYLYNFAKYIKWPAEFQKFVIGVYGESAIINDLTNTLKGKKVWGFEIEVRTIISNEMIPECHIIYLPVGNSRNILTLREKVGAKSILIASEEDLIKKGAIISFIIEDGRLRFKLNKKALGEAGLTASEGLLKLAIIQ